jgi:hypothetical protein
MQVIFLIEDEITIAYFPQIKKNGLHLCYSKKEKFFHADIDYLLELPEAILPSYQQLEKELINEFNSLEVLNSN